jgi:uncharacterized protein YbjT (DUF2867 family)
MYAITGVTGRTGSVVAETLLAQGKQVRVVVRDLAKGTPWKARGAQVAIADFDDLDALTRAFAGTQGAYVLLPPRPTSTDPIGANAKLAASIATAVRASGVPHVVLLSSFGAQHADGTGPIRALHSAERELAGTGAGLTVVRAANFQENWGALLGTLASGAVYSFLLTDLSFPQVSTVDIGRTAAAALVEGAGRGATRVIELAGPREVSGEDVARALTKLTGKPVTVQATPLDAVVPTFTSLGMSKQVAALFREMYEGIIAGRVAIEGGKARALRGSVGIEETLAQLLSRAAERR